MAEIKFNLEIPINATSLGQIGYGVAYEIFKRGLSPNIFPIGGIDLKSVIKDTNFEYWLDKCCKSAWTNGFQDLPTVKHWHLSGSERRLGKGKQVLWTVHECSELTPFETEICRGYDQVLVTSKYSQEVFKSKGIETDLCPNFFDELHFKEVEVPQPAKYNWGIFGKMEKRKQTRNQIIAWANLYGGNNDHRLVCQVYNSFLDQINPNLQAQEINNWFQGRKPFNIVFLPYQETNETYNKLLNEVDIVLGLNSAEGWNLPLHYCLALGKHAVVLNSTGHKEFATPDNCILVEPTGTEKIADGIFFHEGGPFNQGNMPNFTLAAAQEGFKKVLDKLGKDGKINEAGKQLRSFTVQNTVNKLLSYVDHTGQ